MLSLDASNLTKIDKKHSLSLEKYLKQIQKRNQGFYKIINDKNLIKEINAFEKKIRNKFKHIVVLGIGGSALGILALSQSLKHLYENELTNSKTPRLHVIDNIDPVLIKELEDVIDYSKTLFIVATKSGSTVETGTQYFYFREQCKKRELNIKNHFVIITEQNKSFLRKTAEEEGLKIFNVPRNICGRFSIFSAISLLPARLIGIDISKIIKGAKKNTKETAFQLAKIQYNLYKKGKTINVLMPYSQNLIGLANWYRQLLAESIGKNSKIGITPINALGVTDQHSQLQLYSDGPNDKLIIVIEVKNFAKKIIIPNPYPEKKALKFLNKNLTFNELINIEKDSTIASLTKKQKPSIKISIDRINEESIGEILMMFMWSVAFLGELFKINTYNQPGVEESKSLTKKAIIKNSFFLL